MGKIFIINDTSITAGVASTNDIGTSTLTWKNGYFSGTITVGTVSATGAVIANSASIATLLTVGTVSATGALIGSSASISGTLTVGTVSATGSIIGGTGSFTGTLSVGTLSATGAGIFGTTVTATTASFSGAIIGATSLTVGTASVAGNLIVGGVASVTGNIIGGATLTIGTVSATGNIIGVGGSISGTIILGTVSAIGAIIGSTSLTIGTGTIIAAKITATTGSFTALLTAATASFSGNLFVGGTASIGGAIIGSTILTIGTVSATGAIIGVGGSISGTLTLGTVSATGAIIGNSASIATLITVGTVSASGAIIATSGSVLNTFTIGTASISGAVIADSGSIANLLTVGTMSASGDVRVSGVVVATALQSSTAAYPRTTRITSVDMLDIMNGAYVWPTGSSATFNLVRHSPAITAIDNSNPNITVFQITPSWSYDTTQGWGLLPKNGLNFAPTLVSNVNAASTDSIIFQAVNAQPSINNGVGPRTITNVFALAGDPRNVGSAGTITNMVCVRARGNTSSGSTVTNFYAMNIDSQLVASSSVGNFYGINVGPTLSGNIGTFTGFQITDSTAPSGNNIAFYHVGTSAHSRFQGSLQVGADAAPQGVLHINRAAVYTANNQILNITGTLAPTGGGIQAGINMGATFAPGTSAPSNVLALNMSATITSTLALASIQGINGVVTFNSGYTNTITVAVGFNAGNPSGNDTAGGGSCTTYVQFRASDNTATGITTKIGFYQVGTNAHNRFNGNVQIGADATPTTALSVTGSADFSGSVSVATGTIIAAKITATTGSFTALLTAGTASISGAIIGGTSVTAGTGSFSGLIAGGTLLTVGTVSATGNGIFGGSLAFSTGQTMVGERAYITFDFTSAATTLYKALPFSAKVIDCWTTSDTTPRTCSGFTLAAGSAGTVFVATVALVFNTAAGQQVQPTLSAATLATASALRFTVTTAGTAANFSATVVIQRTV